MSNWRKGVFNTTCKYGHILAGDNLRITTKRRSFGIQYERVCRACHAIHSMEYWERQKSMTIKSRKELGL